METKLTFRLVLVLATLGAGGCVGSGPNTQQGAVTGGVLGAIAGAVIGNNRGSGNAASGAAIGAVAGGIAGGTLGNQADHRRGTIYRSEQEATTQEIYEAPSPPPPPRRERQVVYDRPSREAVWIDGHYEYDGRGYFWVDGYWEVPPPRYRHYVAPRWERRGNVHVYIRGYWRG
jgi:hypothetical protein